jgi:hypothetical protein
MGNAEQLIERPRLLPCAMIIHNGCASVGDNHAAAID